MGALKNPCKMDKKEFIKTELEKMLAIETLEYYDKNLLSGDNKTRSEDRIKTLNILINTIKTI